MLIRSSHSIKEVTSTQVITIINLLTLKKIMKPTIKRLNNKKIDFISGQLSFKKA